MAIYAISDLHLSFANPKPMDIFGPAWTDHADRIRRNWESLVTHRDVVLMPGDLSWAMKIEEAVPDLEFIAGLPGTKLLIRGNHDYWWNRKATARIQRMVHPSIILLQGTSAVVDGAAVTGTRGWRPEVEPRASLEFPEVPTKDSEGPNAQRILVRELAYLERGLSSLPADASPRIAMLHFPPFDEKMRPNEFARLLMQYKVDIVVYGHIHEAAAGWSDARIDGVEAYAVSADLIDFTPLVILR